jgi:hypothetical protein
LIETGFDLKQQKQSDWINALLLFFERELFAGAFCHARRDLRSLTRSHPHEPGSETPPGERKPCPNQHRASYRRNPGDGLANYACHFSRVRETQK